MFSPQKRSKSPILGGFRGGQEKNQQKTHFFSWKSLEFKKKVVPLHRV